ncbi:MAG: hypothetical protein KKH72_08440 [Alphaproteobacteria bacterium]|nr:hypothetical protein [Alphaproteobacteria bacterium]
MSDDKSENRPAMPKLTTRDYIYGVVLVVGFVLIASGLNGAMGWNLADWLITALGATAGVATAFALSWLRRK